ncbi:MAG: hypothetical protein IJF55_00065 [Clostridia bacterium]|nr:hypothetical protein [Clostridia bacterium]
MKNIYKGVERKMIVVKNPGEEGFFDEVHFILKSGMENTEKSYEDMVSEASRIIDAQYFSSDRKRKSTIGREILFFSLGIFSSLALFLAFLIFYIG